MLAELHAFVLDSVWFFTQAQQENSADSTSDDCRHQNDARDTTDRDCFSLGHRTSPSMPDVHHESCGFRQCAHAKRMALSETERKSHDALREIYVLDFEQRRQIQFAPGKSLIDVRVLAVVEVHGNLQHGA